MEITTPYSSMITISLFLSFSLSFYLSIYRSAYLGLFFPRYEYHLTLLTSSFPRPRFFRFPVKSNYYYYYFCFFPPIFLFSSCFLLSYPVCPALSLFSIPIPHLHHSHTSHASHTARLTLSRFKNVRIIQEIMKRGFQEMQPRHYLTCYAIKIHPIFLNHILGFYPPPLPSLPPPPPPSATNESLSANWKDSPVWARSEFGKTKAAAGRDWRLIANGGKRGGVEKE
ncbi:hypothetical protein B9Z19DRAFT_110767 [Tuber borchii]|uniref:Uncharacterized protein n=1 Tax=Tuber borchii TaxID=42251 RepID=A0A2T7A6T8_TUBBO|nr:hypothetical protein B9Z19DRAFT_110767 [Tuber borchii]